MTCKRCSTRLDAAALWCHSCGLWASDTAGVCEGAELETATGACIVCGTPVCGTCGISKEGRTYCDDPTHQDVTRTHVLLDRYVSEFEADWVSANLAAAGIHTMMFGFRSRPGLHGLPLDRESVVFVRRDEEEMSRDILKQYADTKGS